MGDPSSSHPFLLGFKSQRVKRFHPLVLAFVGRDNLGKQFAADLLSQALFKTYGYTNLSGRDSASELIRSCASERSESLYWLGLTLLPHFLQACWPSMSTSASTPSSPFRTPTWLCKIGE